MKVTILTEGSSEVGFGHITRCASLYEAFEERGITPEFIINGDNTIEELLGNKKYKIFNWFERENETLDLINGVEVVIVDSYLANYKFYKKVSELVKFPVYVDDFKRLDYPVGIVINGAIHAEDLGYPEREGTTHLLGIKYCPLKKEFWDVPKKIIKENIESIMVTFGGNDHANMTLQILKLLVAHYPDISKKIIVGRGFTNIGQIESVADNKTEIIFCPGAEEMKKVMIESDVCISAAGQTLYELARIGIPTIAIATADNQLNNIIGWQKEGFIEYAGSFRERETLDNIQRSIKILENKDKRVKKAKIGIKPVDGMGSKRIVEVILKNHSNYFKNENMQNYLKTNIKVNGNQLINFINLTNDEKEMLRNWRNHESVRVWMYQEHIISPEEHNAYLKQLKENNNTFCWILRNMNSENIGVISINRVDFVNKNAYLGIYLNPDHKAPRAGRLLNDSLKQVAFKIINLHTLKLEVLSNNTRALKFYKKLGFLEEGRLKEFVYKNGKWHDVVIMGITNR